MNIKNLKFRLVGSVLLLAGVAASSVAQSKEQLSAHAEHAMAMAGGMKCGAAHRTMMKKRNFTISMQNYTVPDVKLLDRAGKPVSLETLLEGDQPVAVNFIFTTCTTICPIMSATFAQMRRKLGPDADRIQLVSITIDPEHDSPAVLSEYAKRYNATPQWHFLTGKPKDIEKVLRIFDAWTGTKTNHRPITLMHAKGGNKWMRVEGLASGTALAEQARMVLE